MNRYTAAGLHAAALNGETTTVVAIDLDVADRHFHDYLDHAGTDDTNVVSHVLGRKQVRYPSGGTIRFTSYAAGQCGTNTPVALCYDWREWLDESTDAQRAAFTARANNIIPGDA